MGKTNPKLVARLRRKRRVRGKIVGTPQRPRLSVFRSSKHIYAQVIDDTNGVTLASMSDLAPQVRDGLKDKKKGEKAHEVGEALANRCKELGIEKVVFDRNGYIYHGRIRELAEGARKGGLEL